MRGKMAAILLVGVLATVNGFRVDSLNRSNDALRAEMFIRSVEASRLVDAARHEAAEAELRAQAASATAAAVIEDNEALTAKLKAATAKPKVTAVSSRGVEREGQFVVTAYCPGPCKTCGTSGRTATGTRAGRGQCAVDPRVIPHGTRLFIPGYGEAVATDTGGAIKGNRIDVCFPTHAEALRWGRRTVTVKVVGR